MTPYEQGAADERSRIAWWLRAGLDGPALVNTTEAQAADTLRLVKLLEGTGERWSECPTTPYPSTSYWPRRLGSGCSCSPDPDTGELYDDDGWTCPHG